MKKLYFAIVALLLCAISASAADITSGTKLYLKPNANWKVDGARFAAYFFGNGDAWVSMTIVEGETDIYEVTSPNKSFTNVIFCRMNPGNQTNNWDSRWNQTGDLEYDGTNNLYTVKEGTWSQGGGTWSKYDVVYAEVPTFSESEGFFADELQLTITAEAGATIYYSIDETDPSLVYSAPITISETTTVKAYAKVDGKENSPVVSSTYTKQTENFTETKIYVKGDAWLSDGAWLAAYFFGNGETWVALNEVTDQIGLVNYYEVSVPEGGYNNVIFCRMNGEANTMDWNTKWNQTGDLTLSADKNLCTLNDDLNAGTWSTLEATAAPVINEPTFRYFDQETIGWDMTIQYTDASATTMYDKGNGFVQYSGAFSGSLTTTVQAYAYATGKLNSEIVTKEIAAIPTTYGYIYVNDNTGKEGLTLSAEGLIFGPEQTSWGEVLTRSGETFTSRFAYAIIGEQQESYDITYTWGDETSKQTTFAPAAEETDGFVSFEGDTITGIDGIEAENAPVEYFNLQGVRVANPENGLYIRRQGNKVEKVFLNK